MCGIDGSGKTTLLYKLKGEKVVETIPTIGFNVETITYNRKKFTIWDAGGQAKIRPLWHEFIHSKQVLIYVVDASDRTRLDEAKDEFHRILWWAIGRRYMTLQKESPLFLVLANKQDVDGAMSCEEVREKLELDRVCEPWARDVIGTSALSGEGLDDVLEWMRRRHGSSKS